MRLFMLITLVLLPLIRCMDYLGYFPDMPITKSYTSSIIARDEHFDIKMDKPIEQDQIMQVDHLRTKIFFQKEFERSSFELREIIKVAIEKITKNIQPKIRTKRGIIYVSPCNDNKYKYGMYQKKPVKICDTGCIRNEHLNPQILQRCFVKRLDSFEVIDTHNTLYINLDLMITVNLVNDCPKNDSLVYAGPAQLAKDDNRPDIGVMWICNNTMLTNPANIVYINEAVQEGLIHILGFTPAVFPYYRSYEGEPLTKLDRYNEPIEGQMDYLGIISIPKAGVNVLTFSERLEKKPDGSKTRVKRPILNTHHLSRVSEIYFGCDKIKGVYLEEQGEAGIYLSHFEKRIFNNELMTAGLKVKSSLSLFTIALLKDTGWYSIPNPSSIENPFTFGKNTGCDFLEMSCQEYIESKESKNQSITPFCNKCNARIDKNSLVNNLKPDSCMMFKPKDKNVAATYPDSYAEHCPITYNDYKGLNPNLSLGDICKVPSVISTEAPLLSTTTSDETMNEQTTEPNVMVTTEPGNIDNPVPTSEEILVKKECIQNEVKYEKSILIPIQSVQKFYDCNKKFRLLMKISDQTFQCSHDNQTVLYQEINMGKLLNYYLQCPTCSDLCHENCPTKYSKWEDKATTIFKKWKIAEPISITCINNKPVFTKTMVYNEA